MMANRTIRTILFHLLDLLEILVQRVTPKGQHTRLRWYHRQPVWILDGEATVLPNTRRAPASQVIQMVDPKAPARRSTTPSRRAYNWLCQDLAAGQALVLGEFDGRRYTTVLPKGLKKGSGRSQYGCNGSIHPHPDGFEPCSKVPVQMTGWLNIGDAYLVDCKAHVAL